MEGAFLCIPLFPGDLLNLGGGVAQLGVAVRCGLLVDESDCCTALATPLDTAVGLGDCLLIGLLAIAGDCLTGDFDDLGLAEMGNLFWGLFILCKGFCTQ